MNCDNIKKLSLAPMIKVEVWVLEVITHITHQLLDILSLLELCISENHLALVPLNIVCEIELLVFIKHLQKYFVIGVALRFIRHVGGD